MGWFAAGVRIVSSIAPVMMLCAMGCSGGSPNRPTSVAVVPTPATTSPAGVLEITTFTALARGGPVAGFFYEIELAVSETSGKGGVTITGVALTTPDGSSDTGCSPVDVPIPAGGTWRSSALGYCEPQVPTSALVERVSASVSFLKGDQTRGVLRAVTSVRR